MGMRDFLRQQIEGTEVEQVPPSRQLAEYAAGMRQYEADKAAAEEAEAATPAPQSLVAELRGLIAQPNPLTWREVRAELDRRTEARRGQSVAEALEEAIGPQEQSDVPGLNDQRLLQIAAGTPDAPRSVREEVAGVLRGLWDSKDY
jgi:hypothetical protein